MSGKVDSNSTVRDAWSRNEEAGLSLIELIIVLVIFGALVAIAIPLFLSVQGEADTNAVKAAAATGALQVVGDIAAGKIPVAGSTIADLTTGTMIVTIDGAGAPTIDTLCVKATNGAATWFAGAGALPDGSGCS